MKHARALHYLIKIIVLKKETNKQTKTLTYHCNVCALSHRSLTFAAATNHTSATAALTESEKTINNVIGEHRFGHKLLLRKGCLCDAPPPPSHS